VQKKEEKKDNLLSSTGAASVLSLGIMNPKPFWLLKNLTLPVLRATGADIVLVQKLVTKKE